MRQGAALLILMLAAIPPANAAADDGMTPAIAQCLQQNAASVEAAEPDLTRATDYLVSAACASPIAEEQRRLNMVRVKASAERDLVRCQKRVDEKKARDAKQPTSFERSYEDCQRPYDMVMDSSRYAGGFGTFNSRPPSAISMAAKLIVTQRLARNKSRP
ncbi:MAG TPA: hypothetical protein VJS85_05510 [Rhizomicrobium sp.]|nr:hypothetical protein [Rhizomicrobium sp.]